MLLWLYIVKNVFYSSSHFLKLYIVQKREPESSGKNKTYEKTKPLKEKKLSKKRGEGRRKHCNKRKQTKENKKICQESAQKDEGVVKCKMWRAFIRPFLIHFLSLLVPMLADRAIGVF